MTEYWLTFYHHVMGCDFGVYVYFLRASTLLTVFILFHWMMYKERYRIDPGLGAKFCGIWGLIKITIGLFLWNVFDLGNCEEIHFEYLFCILIGVCCLLVGLVYYKQIPLEKSPNLLPKRRKGRKEGSKKEREDKTIEVV